MADRLEPMTDDAIEGIVRMVEAADVLSQTLDCSCAQAMRTMLKSIQVMTKMQATAGTSALRDMVSATRKVQ